MGDLSKYAFVGVVSFVIGFMLGRNSTKDTIERTLYKTDTIRLSTIDTLTLKKPLYRTYRIVDTIRIAVDSTRNVTLPISQKHYSKDSVYDAWISGYEPNLDSIRIYEKTNTEVVTNTIIETHVINKWGIYPSLGYIKSENNEAATIGITFKSPKKWLFGANVGIDGNNKAIYGITIGYNIK